MPAVPGAKRFEGEKEGELKREGAGTWFAMTDAERRMALLLSPARVSYTPGSWDKKFARSLADQAESPLPLITARQREHLLRLLYKYRRQIPHAQLERAGAAQERLL